MNSWFFVCAVQDLSLIHILEPCEKISKDKRERGTRWERLAKGQLPDIRCRKFSDILASKSDHYPYSDKYIAEVHDSKDKTGRTEREHMVEWFRANETKGSGAYSRQVPNQSARRCYNGLMNAASLLWKMCIRDSTHGAGVAQDLKTFASYNAGPHELVCGMYPQILLDEAGRVAYTSFLEVLLEGDGGAYLWHCTCLLYTS